SAWFRIRLQANRKLNPRFLPHMLETFDLKDLGLPALSSRSFRLNSAKTVAEGVFRPTITSKELSKEFTETVGLPSEEFQFSTRIFQFEQRTGDQGAVQAADNRLPLIVRRDGEVIVNFA